MKILLPVDGSELALEAVRHALALRAEGLATTFVLVNVQEPDNLYERVVALDAEVFERMGGAAGAQALAGAATLLQAAGVPFESEIAAGDPAHTLIDIAERHGCEAIIMGAHGRGALSGTLRGSVSQAIVHHSPIPVTIVKPRPEEMRAAEDPE